MTFAAALEASLKRPADLDALVALADTALREGEEENALPIISRALARSPAARLWQWKALLERSLDEHEEALKSFREAARLDPSDARIAHGRARVALEAGVPAEALFEQALRLSRSDGAVFLGLVAARLAAGRGEQAEAELDAALGRSPLWIEGHRQLAQLRSMLGKRPLASASLERAAGAHPQQAPLWQALFDLELKTDDFEGLDETLERARSAGLGEPMLIPYAAIAASELGRVEEADRLFAANEASGGPRLAVWKVRHLLRTGRIADASAIIDQELEGPEAAAIWPYAGIAWRLADDARWTWLARDGKLIATFDLSADLPPLDRLAEVLRSIHSAKGEYLDQSVRGGTQTDGPLFSRIEPEIRALRSAVVKAVERYAGKLPEPDAKHPLLRHRRDRRVRFAGSWSVRLRGKGFHTSHVHPQGWISSALYVALPPGVEDDPNAGWLQLGEPRPELNLPLCPLQLVRPEPGRLVLFPSWMWHGTMPFPAGERLTVAFDVSAPR